MTSYFRQSHLKKLSCNLVVKPTHNPKSSTYPAKYMTSQKTKRGFQPRIPRTPESSRAAITEAANVVFLSFMTFYYNW
ncbi:hypothetical protein CEXT_335741 [Caerostris extrusa]|uniref:Uncharacterized protein n=1 Tax=Caerostris extrusa TaxID=172846 RepID=A0AAV4QXV3_CAEEX|nr:hypothetical protein CEXT_335741 [Caerostris extrusa]